MNETVIEIERVPLSFVAAAAPDRAERVSRRVRDAVARTLPDALAAACGPDLDADDSYVFIDRIDVQCTVGGHWTDDAIARVFAERVAGALGSQRQPGHALVFHDRAEYVSAFLAAAVDGGASSRWWFAEFEGLRHLPLSALIRTLVIAEGETGWNALADVSPELLLRVLSSLAASDAERILDAIPASPTAAEPAVDALIAAFESSATAPLASAAHRELAALVYLVRTQGTTLSTKSRATLHAMMEIVALARDGRMDAPIAEWTSLADKWCEAAGLSASARQAIIHFVSTTQTGAVVDTPAPMFDFTPFGGALLLAVVLVRSGTWQRWRDMLRDHGRPERAESRAARLALAVVARALAPKRASQVERDPVLRRVFGVAAHLGTFRGPSLGQSLREHAQTLLEETARRIPGCEGSTEEYLRSQCLALTAAVRADGAAARLGRPPLDVLVGFSGLKRATITLPDGRSIALTENS